MALKKKSKPKPVVQNVVKDNEGKLTITYICKKLRMIQILIVYQNKLL